MSKPMVAITTSSFGNGGDAPFDMLRKRGIDFRLNPHGRTLEADELIEMLVGCQGVVAGTEIYDKKVLSQVKGLKIISRCGVGVDAVDVEECRRLGIKVTTTPDGPVYAVAELVMAFVLDLLRHVTFMHEDMRKGIWKKYMGRLLRGKTMGILGFGRIGRAVAELSKALGARVVFYDPLVSSNEEGCQRLKLKDFWPEIDILTIHMPFSEENKNFVGAQQMALMRKEAVVVNCSRGGILDEAALKVALDEEKLAAAALDVYDKEPYQGILRSHPKVLLTPHIGSYAKEARFQMECDAVTNLIAGLNL